MVAGQNGGAVLTGGSVDPGDWDVWVMGLDRDGEVVWQRTVQGSDRCEMGCDIAPTHDDGVLVVTGGCNSAMVVKLGVDGSFVGDCPALVEPGLATEPIEIEISDHPAPLVEADLAWTSGTIEVLPVSTPVADLCAQ